MSRHAGCKPVDATPPGQYRDVLLTFDGVGDGSGDDADVDRILPRELACVGAVSGEPAVRAPLKDQIALCR